jgi:universal stress protein A
LTLLHVVEYLPPIDIAYEPAVSASWVMDEEEMRQQAQASLLKLSDKHRLVDARQVVVVGTPKREIGQYARDNNCDLVVLGSHGRHGIGLLLGSTANGVLHDMPCDVLAVKIGDESG